MMIYHASVALGEAYVVVRADLRGFTRDLKSQLKQVVSDFEKDVNEQLGVSLKRSAEKDGEKVGDGLSKGLKKRLGDRRHEPWVTITAAFASALDDGISALPTEVKFAIVAGLLAAAPLIGGSLAALVTGAVGVGVVAIGVLLGAQFEQVRDRFAEFQTDARNTLVQTAEAFGPALVHSLDLVEQRLRDWSPMLTRIFDRAAPLLEELIGGALRGIESVLGGIDVNFDQIGSFVTVFADGIGELGGAFGDLIGQLAATGDEGRQAFSDLIDLLVTLTSLLGTTLQVLTWTYSRMRDVAEITGLISSAMAVFGDNVREADTRIVGFRDDLSNAAEITEFLAAATKKEEKAAKEVAKAIDDQRRAMDQARDAAFGLIDAELAYEQAIDDLDETLKKNGDTLTFETNKGRENIRKLENAIQQAQQRAEERFNSGQLGWQQAQQLYKEEIAEIYKLAAAHGLTKKELDKVFARTLDLVNLPNPDPDYWKKQADAARRLANELARALEKAARIRKLAASGSTIRWGAGQLEGFADGGMVTRDSIIRAGEGNRPEVVIPLTKPARAAQLAEQSGLTRMISGAVNTVVQVFVGDEPLEQKMYRVVQSNQRTNTFDLAYGTR